MPSYVKSPTVILCTGSKSALLTLLRVWVGWALLFLHLLCDASLLSNLTQLAVSILLVLFKCIELSNDVALAEPQKEDGGDLLYMSVGLWWWGRL